MSLFRVIAMMGLILPLCLMNLLTNVRLMYDDGIHPPRRGAQSSNAVLQFKEDDAEFLAHHVPTTIKRQNHDDLLLSRPTCQQNPFVDSLDTSLSTIVSRANSWLHDDGQLLTRFAAFQQMASCKQEAERQSSVCGVDALVDDSPCVIYSAYSTFTISGWERELDLLERTPCDIHVFTCSEPQEEDKADDDDDEYYYYNDDDEYSTEEEEKKDNNKNKDQRRMTSFKLHDRIEIHSTCLRGEQALESNEKDSSSTLKEVSEMLGHDQIDLLLLNTNGDELSILSSLANDSDASHFPMQIVTKLFYPAAKSKLQMAWPSFSLRTGKPRQESFLDNQAQGLLLNLQRNLLRLGYATIDRHDNVDCDYCSTDIALIRFQCDPSRGNKRKSNKNKVTLPKPVKKQQTTKPKQDQNKTTIIVTTNTNTTKSHEQQSRSIKVTSYSQQDMYKTIPHFHGHPMRLLVFDPKDNTFNTYNILYHDGRKHKSPDYQRSWCRRCSTLVPILVDALRSQYPKRFTNKSPPFQMVFSTNDSVLTDCVNDFKKCSTNGFAPVVSFGTVPKDPKLLPSVQPFPLHFFEMCMFNWLAAPRLQHPQKCKFIPKSSNNQNTSIREFKDLIPQVIWRGTDYKFTVVFDKFQDLIDGKDFLNRDSLTLGGATQVLLDKFNSLRPRWQGVALSLKAELQQQEADKQKQQQKKKVLPWIDCKFVATNSKSFDPNHPGTEFVTAPRMSSEEMSRYKYHVDFGGVGGTTWLGTISKLAMPGLLFHHETVMRDWFFDEIQPWVHYVPVKLDLSDLHDMYLWAEAHPVKAQEIAKTGMEFALNMMSEEYMRHTYDKYFVKTLGEIVDSYQPASKEENLHSILKSYEANDFEVHQFSNCGTDSCIVRTRKTTGWNHSLPLGIDNKFGEEDNPDYYSSKQ